jgi:hypothetical protein
MLALGSRFLILYSSIISFKYSMNDYSTEWQGSIKLSDQCEIDVPSKLITFIRYTMLTFLGVLMTVIPIQILDVSRVIADLFAAVMEACAGLCGYHDFKLFDKVDNFFEHLIKGLTGLNIYHIKSLKYTSDITRLTYEDLIWIAL